MFSMNCPLPDAHWLVMRVAEHLAALVHADGPRVERAHVERAARPGAEPGGAARVRRHAVEVAAPVLDEVPLAGGGDVVHRAAVEPGGGEQRLVALRDHDLRIAPAHALVHLAEQRGLPARRHAEDERPSRRSSPRRSPP